MYTVLRFQENGLSNADASRLYEEAQREFGRERVGAHRAGGFACDISTESDPHRHMAEVEKCLLAHQDWVRRYANTEGTGPQVGIDIALEPEDYAGRSVHSVRAESALLRLLGLLGMSFEVTLYVGDGKLDSRPS